MSSGRTAMAIVRRLLPAPPELVYDVWLDAEAVAEFISPAPSRTGRIDWRPQPGNRFLIEMVDTGVVVTVTGVYLELERPRRLRFTWRSDLGGGFDSVVTVTLEPSGGNETMMTIEHDLLPEAWQQDHERGWTAIAGHVERALSSRRDGGRGAVSLDTPRD